MGGCVSKQGEANFNVEDKPYERQSKKRISFRKSKRKKDVSDIVATNQQPDSKSEDGVEPKEGEELEKEELMRQPSQDNNDSQDEKEDITKRPVPVPRTRSKENLLESTKPPPVVPRKHKNSSISSSDSKSITGSLGSLSEKPPAVAPRTSKPVKQPSKEQSQDSDEDDAVFKKDRKAPGNKSTRTNAVQVLPPMPTNGFSLKKSTPVLERQHKVEIENNDQVHIKKEVIETKQTVILTKTDPPAEDAPPVPPKDVNQFLSDLDYAIPSQVMGSKITKDSPKKALKPPATKPTDTSQIILQMKNENRLHRTQTIDDHPPLPPTCAPPDNESGLYWVTDVTKAIPSARENNVSTFQSVKTTKTTTKTTVKTAQNNNMSKDIADGKTGVETTV